MTGIIIRDADDECSIDIGEVSWGWVSEATHKKANDSPDVRVRCTTRSRGVDLREPAAGVDPTS